mgnify:CR=1 FL=1
MESWKAEGEAAAVKAVLIRALESPLSAIVENSGEDSKKIMAELKNKKDAWQGFNAYANKIDDLKKAGIIDPLKVTKTAFLNAVSVAATYLTVGASLVDKPEPKTPPGGGGMPPGGMGGMDY